MLRTRRTTRADRGLRPGLSIARTLPASRTDQWLSGADTFDPTKYGITWELCSWTDDPAWLPSAAGARVSSVRDASGNSRHLTQTTEANRPALLAADSHLGGRPSIRGGYNTFLTSPTFGALSQPVSYVFIGYASTPYWNTASTGAVMIDNGATAGNNTLWAATGSGAAGKMTMQTGTAVAGTRDMRSGVWVGKGGASGLVSRNGVTNLSGNTGTNTMTQVSVGNLNHLTSFPKFANWGGWAMVGVYSGDITAHANWVAFLTDAQRYYGLLQAPALVAIDGDSRCTNYPHGATPNPTPAQVWPALISNTATNLLVPNFGVPAQTQVQMNADAAAQVDAIYSAAYAKNVAICTGGLNDCVTADTAATIETNIQTWCTTRQAAGFKVIVATMPPAASVTGANDTKRAAVNTWIKANYGTFADQLVDLDGDARLQTTGNTTYFLGDGVHYTAGGHAVVAELMKPALAALGVNVADVPAAVPHFDPMSLSPQAWFDASVPSSISSTGGLVDQWNDLSGNANHLTAAGSARPTTGAATQNGLNALGFNGSSTVLASTASITAATQTWYVVAKLTQANPNNNAVASIGPNSTADSTIALYASGTLATGPWYAVQGAASANVGVTRSTSDMAIWAVAFNGAGTIVGDLEINGTHAANYAGTLAAGTPGGTERLNVGALSKTSARYWWSGTICEVIVYSGVHDLQTINYIQNWLASKWGTT